MKTPYFKFYVKDFAFDIHGMTDAQIGKMMRALIDVYKTGENQPSFASHSIFKALHDAEASYLASCERNATNRLKTNATKPKQQSNSPPKEEKPEAKKRASKIPDDFMPDASCVRVAQEEGFTNETFNRELASFIDYWKGCGKLKPDWQATFRNWLRNGKKFNRQAPGGKRQEPKSDVEIAANVLHEMQNQNGIHGTRDGLQGDYNF